MGTVEARVRDLFGGTSDLIVLPCSTAGTITQFTLDRLKQFNIPFRPAKRMAFGEININPFEGGEKIAQYVAYAASVDGNQSSPEAIRHIGLRLGEYTSANDAVRYVSAPLLGTGAGRLTPKVAALNLSEGFKRSSHNDARLILCVLNDVIYEEIAEIARLVPDTHIISQLERPIRVFLSYSRGKNEHLIWVKKLATFLRENGIDARLDQWHLRHGMDLQHFMLKMADRVIIISDQPYAEKADGRHGGVGWETMLIQGDIKDLPPHNTKYLVIARDENFEQAVPLFLKTKFAVHWPSEVSEQEKKDALLRELYDAVEIPALGPRPVHL